MNIYHDSYKKASKQIIKTDKARSTYYNNISGSIWGNPKNYDIVIDSTNGVKTATKEILTIIAEIRSIKNQK